jgi:hypothetical protein
LKESDLNENERMKERLALCQPFLLPAVLSKRIVDARKTKRQLKGWRLFLRIQLN